MDRTREKYEKKRNKFNFLERVFLNKLVKPKWARDKGDKRFDVIYRDQDLLYAEGKVVLANIFKANTHLFKSGEYDCPAAVVYSEDPYFEENFNELEIIVSQLIDISNGYCDYSEFRNISRILNEEMSAHFNILLPQSMCEGRKVYFTTIMVHRKHLPASYLKSTWFPMLVCPSRTKASMILPYYFWDKNLAKMWMMKERPRRKAMEAGRL